MQMTKWYAIVVMSMNMNTKKNLFKLRDIFRILSNIYYDIFP